MPGLKVLVHVDATESAHETIFDKIRLIAAETEGIRNVHSLHVSRISSSLSTVAGSSLDTPQKQYFNGALVVEEKKSLYASNEPPLHLYLDVQMGPSLDLNTAHSIVDSFEGRLKKEIPQIKDITTHLEIESSIEDLRMAGIEKRIGRDHLMKINEAMLSVDEVFGFKDIRVFDDVNGERHITLTICLTTKNGTVATSLTLEDAHKIATKVQNMIINCTGATRVVVHTETDS